MYEEAIGQIHKWHSFSKFDHIIPHVPVIICQYLTSNSDCEPSIMIRFVVTSKYVLILNWKGNKKYSYYDDIFNLE